MSTAVQKTTEPKEHALEFVPFGAVDKIKLSINVIKKFVAVPTKSGVQCDDAEAMRFMMMCQAQRLNPFVGDCFLVGYDTKNGPKFNKITAHQVFLKRAEGEKSYEGLESGVILKSEDGVISEREGDFADEGENVVGGWCRVHRTGKRPMYKRLAISQRKPEYTTQFWEGNKAYEQIVKCAEADCLRASFPNLLAGLRVEGETINIEATIVPTDPSTREMAGQVNALPEQSRLNSPAKSETLTPQKQLEAWCLAENFTFDQFRKFAAADQGLENSDSIASFEELPAELCQRMLRSPDGLRKQLKLVKEAK